MSESVGCIHTDSQHSLVLHSPVFYSFGTALPTRLCFIHSAQLSIRSCFIHSYHTYNIQINRRINAGSNKQSTPNCPQKMYTRVAEDLATSLHTGNMFVHFILLAIPGIDAYLFMSFVRKHFLPLFCSSCIVNRANATRQESNLVGIDERTYVSIDTWITWFAGSHSDRIIHLEFSELVIMHRQEHLWLRQCGMMFDGNPYCKHVYKTYPGT